MKVYTLVAGDFLFLLFFAVFKISDKNINDDQKQQYHNNKANRSLFEKNGDFFCVILHQIQFCLRLGNQRGFSVDGIFID